jgi:phosphoribosylamine--glycine ligase
MRILLVSKEGDGLGLAQRLALEGNAVSAWVREERFHRALSGIVSRVSTYRASLRRADLVITDCVGFGKLGDEFRANGVPFIGASEPIDKIELDRQVGMDFFRRAGITIPETEYHNSAREALGAKRDFGDGWVIKPCGNKATALTMVVTDEELWEHCLGKVPPGCPLILQRIVKGVEVSTEGWFNGRAFITPFNHTFEEKRFLAGNLGCNTGCMGNVVVARESNKLTKHTVERVAPFLKMIGYRGPFDINCIVNKEGAYALEATGRMGYDAVEALSELLDEPLGDFLFEVATGTKAKAPLGRDSAIAVRLSIPPWPVQKPDGKSHGEPVLGLTDEVLEHVFLTDVYKEGKAFLTAAGDGVLLKATARSPNLSVAQRKVYKLLDGIKVSSKQYRNDIGGRVSDDMAQLQAWGWL